MECGYGLMGLALLIVPLMIASSEAFTFFNVGGKDGWVVNPSQDYSHWAQRYTFQVNDILYFKYKRGTDSVLIVTKEAYDSCNTTKPLHRFKGGGSTIKLHNSGSFFFISGNVENCKKGQKLQVEVKPVSHNPVHSPSPSSSSPSMAPSTSSPPPPVAPAKSPSVAPVTPTAKSNAPAPAPTKNSGSKNSFGVALGISFVMMVFFSSFA